MLSQSQRQAIFKRGKPATLWEGEPMLGSSYGEEEIDAAVTAIRDSMAVDRGFSGQPIKAFEAEFAHYTGTRYAVALNSAGPGLDMAMRYLNLQPGDEVIVPAINFVAAPLAVMGAGGQVVWCEVDPRTLQMDPRDVEKRITPRTRAIFPVHMNGLSSPMDELLELAQRYPHPQHGPLAVIGDAARACGGEYKGRKIGTQALMTIYSFHTMKNMVTLGEGGMMVTDDEQVAAFFRSTRFYGFELDTWGSSYVMNKVQAAVGSVQLRRLDAFIESRRRLAQRRNELLADVPEIILPYEPSECKHTYYLYTCLLWDQWGEEKRDAILEMMDKEFGVRLLVANKPAYQTRKVLRDHTPGQSLPVSESIGERLFCIPTHPDMSEEDNEYIAAALIECVERLKAENTSK